MKRESKLCRDSKAVQTHLVMPFEVDGSGSFTISNMMKLIDDTTSICVSRHTGMITRIASLDSIHISLAAREGNSVTVVSSVSGVGTTSVEIFCKIIIENLENGLKKIGGTAFLTMICFDQEGNKAQAPKVIAETEEEKFILSGYPERRKRRLKVLEEKKEINHKISPEIPFIGD